MSIEQWYPQGKHLLPLYSCHFTTPRKSFEQVIKESSTRHSLATLLVDCFFNGQPLPAPYLTRKRELELSSWFFFNGHHHTCTLLACKCEPGVDFLLLANHFTFFFALSVHRFVLSTRFDHILLVLVNFRRFPKFPKFP
jgi:hypothetical protein